MTSEIPKQTTNIDNCTFNTKAGLNKETARAVQSIADALKANAEALEMLARSISLENFSACGIRIDGPAHGITQADLDRLNAESAK
ncbi:hypothetical protein [uncultured Roseovarius sp.]|uniref:hypothetical protein n=1 Tax=uncultured Roseovarius sp. TaxID=293344 RepID=UPI000C665925|nr:hypothetical protein [Roseovarius sp.]MBD11612.1 hypothetical protein [Roseovarius sp.]|tara:strand:- start:382 stop:639 length:258 start_codon:yes stop_codon:yes gene_type:complete